MNENLHKARSLFWSALDLETPQQREQYLADVCGDDAELCQQVEELLRAHDEAGDFLQPHPLAKTAADGSAANAGQRDSVTHPHAEQHDLSLDFLTPSDNSDCLGTLGQYEICEVVGHGGMGVVLKAQDQKLGRVVAIKVLATELASNATARQRFRREAQTAAVTHPHVVTIHAVEQSGQLPYLVMEFIDGISLEERIEVDGPLELPEILRIGRQVAAGLAAAHEHGLIHRDVKPGNILLENGVERVKLTDFGLARAVDDVGMTRTGEVAGTPQAMSPEQAQGANVDQRSDLFSLGCVLYAMCTGRSPFRAETTVATLRRVCDDSPRPIREINSDIPNWLVEIIEKLLAKKPEERFQNADELADLLGRRLAELQHPSLARAKPVTALPEADAPRGHRRPNRRWIAAALLLVMFVCGLGFTEATGVTDVSDFVATVLRIKTPQGTLIVKVDDPNVKVAIEGDGGLVITGAGPQEVRLEPGEYQLRASKDGEPVHQELITIVRGGKEVVEVALEGGRGQQETASREELSTGYRSIPAGAVSLVRQFEEHPKPSCNLSYAPDGRYVVSAAGPTLRIWNAETGTLSRMLRASRHNISRIAISPDGRQVAVGDNTGDVRLIDFDTGTPRKTLAGHAQNITAVQYGPRGERLLSADYNGVVRLWDVEAGREIQRFEGGSEGLRRSCGAVSIAPDVRSALLVYGSVLVEWDLQEPDRFTQFLRPPGQGRLETVAFAPGGAVYAAGMASGYICLRRVDSGAEFTRLRGHNDRICSLAFTSDGRHLLSGSEDRSLRVWNIAEGEEIARIDHDDRATNLVALSPDNRFAASVGGWHVDKNYEFHADGPYAVHLWRLPEEVWPIDEQIAEVSRRLERKPDRPAPLTRRAFLYAHQSRWQEAADDLGASLDLRWNAATGHSQEIFSDISLSYHSLCYAALLAHLDQREKYAGFCQAFLDCFEDTPNKLQAHHVTKACLLIPDVFNVSQLPIGIDAAEFSTEHPGYHPIFLQTRALIAYRSGQFEQACECATKALDLRAISHVPHFKARSLFILAMAQHKLHKIDEQATYERALQVQPDSPPVAIETGVGQLQISWLVTDIIHQEAAGLLGFDNGKPAAPLPDPTSKHN